MAQPVAVLVDGDNISGKHAARILAVAVKYGDPAVVRVYLDANGHRTGKVRPAID